MEKMNLAFIIGSTKLIKMHRVDLDKLLAIGRMFERIIGRRLRSECVHTGRIPKTMTSRK